MAAEVFTTDEGPVASPDYYCCIDYEATCVNRYTNPDPQEIIEFPAVLVDAHTGSTIDEFHSYVRPTAHPVLSAFCTNLTGISQDTVDNAPEFEAVLASFHEWLEGNNVTTENCLMVSHGNWDFGSMLKRQCEVSGVELPAWANQWVNIKVSLVEAMPETEGTSKRLRDLVNDLGLEWVGQEHSGIDDTRNIANVLCALLSRITVTANNTKPDVGEIRDGDWMCPNGCGNQFQSRRVCRDCGAPNPDSPAANDGPTPRPGDWNCGQCNYLNFGYRMVCNSCTNPRDPALSLSVPTGRKPGDWNCPACRVVVYGWRDACFRCKTPKPPFVPTVGMVGPPHLMMGIPPMYARGGGGMGGMGGVGGGNIRPGDWPCPACNFNNYASRDACFQCSQPRPYGYPPPGYGGVGVGGVGVGGGGGGGGGRGRGGSPGGAHAVRPGDWPCPQCQVNNYGFRNVCFRCGAEKGGAMQHSAPPPQAHIQSQPPMMMMPAAPAQGGGELPPNFLNGDWICSSCGGHQFASRDFCRDCGGQRS